MNCRSQEATRTSQTLLNDLKSCSIRQDVHWGRKLHAEAVQSGVGTSKYVKTALVKMYAKCGSISDARQMFDSMQKPDVVAWNALLLGYAENGHGNTALELFSKMKTGGCAPDSVTYLALLKACTSLAFNRDSGLSHGLQMGRNIHAEIGCHLTIPVQNTLIHMYANCGSMVEASLVFERIEKPSVVSWTSLLLGYVENGKGETALELFSKMKAQGCSPDSVTYIAVLKACTSLAVGGDAITRKRCLEMGRNIHLEIGCCSNLHVQNTLIDMYVNCGSMSDARMLFDSMHSPDVVSWSSLLLGYAESGQGRVALELFSVMKRRGSVPNSATYIAVIKACTSFSGSSGLEMGVDLHLEIGFHADVHVGNTLIDMYAKCHSLVDAHRVFDSIHKPDVVSWTVLLLGYADNGQGNFALELFSKMKSHGCAPNSLTYVAALKACTSLAFSGAKVQGLEVGLNLHSEIGSELTRPLGVYVQNTLIAMYASCGSMADARQVFESMRKHDTVSWNALLRGYVENGEASTALELFSVMKTRECTPDSVTYVAALMSCAFLGENGDSCEKAHCMECGRSIHLDIGCDSDVHLQSTLIDMYAKCGSMACACEVFNSMEKPNVVSWTALLLGYAENGQGHVALELFSKMNASGCAPNAVTYIAVLKACGSLGALALGRKFHAEITEFTAHLVTCLVDFYGKCASLTEARAVFDLHPKERSISTWTVLLAGYATRGEALTVFSLFEAMQDEGFRPSAITLLSVLSCCRHAALVEKAKEYLRTMPAVYGVIPTVLHYSCIVDALGRANQLDEAIAVLRRMPCNPGNVIWMTLLSACRKWKNVRVAAWAFQCLMYIDEKNPPAYLLMSQIYGSRCMWVEQEKMLSSPSLRR